MEDERREKLVTHYGLTDEESRLTTTRAKRTEFLTTNFILERYLKPKSLLLEVGAATGVYSIHYARQGHRVYARDLVPRHVEVLQARPECAELGIDVGLGNVLDLSEFTDAMFDAVLCLGPFYHLGTMEDRRKCISECLRVLKPGGILALAYICKFFVFAGMVQRDRRYLCDDLRELIMDKEAAVRDPSLEIWFFDSPVDVENLMAEFPVNRLTNAGTDGIAILLADMVNSFSDEEYEQWLKYHFATCEEPSILGYSNHNLYVCRKT